MSRPEAARCTHQQSKKLTRRLLYRQVASLRLLAVLDKDEAPCCPYPDTSPHQDTLFLGSKTLSGLVSSQPSTSSAANTAMATRTAGGNAAFHNFHNDYAHIADPNERRRLALAEVDKAPFGKQ